MTAPADRLLVLLGDDVARACLRGLLERPRTQRELATDLVIAQSATSRALALLRAAGWVEADGLRGATLRVRAPEATRQALLAVDHLADELLSLDTTAQQQRTHADRRLLMDEAEVPGENAG
jgi:DNA-binding IclR family transcriptional regulator